MKITSHWKVNDKSNNVIKQVQKAGKASLKDVIIDIAEDVVKGSPWLTGNNARSIMFEVGPSGEVARTDEEGAVYSTSGYGGYLETGTKRRAATPYFKPSLDRHIHKLGKGIKTRLK